MSPRQGNPQCATTRTPRSGSRWRSAASQPTSTGEASRRSAGRIIRPQPALSQNPDNSHPMPSRARLSPRPALRMRSARLPMSRQYPRLPLLEVRFPYSQVVIHVHVPREPSFQLRETFPCPMIFPTAAGSTLHRIIISERRRALPCGAGSNSADGARPGRYCQEGRCHADGGRSFCISRPRGFGPFGASGRQSPCRESDRRSPSRPTAHPRPGAGPRCRTRRSRRRARQSLM